MNRYYIIISTSLPNLKNLKLKRIFNYSSVTPASTEEPKPEAPEAGVAQTEADLEDGEIEDDEGDEEVPTLNNKEPELPPSVPKIVVQEKEKCERVPDRPPRHDRPPPDRKKDKKRHMTEAEKSILHLRKRERMQREKWEKFRKEQTMEAPPVVDDFAINIEKAIASVLKKDKHDSDGGEKVGDDKRGRKRKNKDKDRLKGSKQRKFDSPKSEDMMDETEFLNIRGGSPNKHDDKNIDRSVSSRSDDSYDSEYSSDRSKNEDRRDRKKEFNKKGKGRNRDRNKKKNREREKRAEQQLKDSQGVCVFFLQGKCQKNDCPYSHEAVPPMKLELCKFYLMECCAKGEKCSYMHSEFPCKFYHTGLPCLQGDNCKFAHGKPLSEGLRQILFKHIETAPREILGGFPRMSREEALNMINQTQQSLIGKFGGVEKSDDKSSVPAIFVNMNAPLPPELIGNEEANKAKPEKPTRNRPSRWQDPDPPIDPTALPPPNYKPFVYAPAAVQDQDMRFTSNGDIDMRTLPIPPMGRMGGTQLAQMAPVRSVNDPPDSATNFTQDIDIRNPNMMQFDAAVKDVDIRNQAITDCRVYSGISMDIRQISGDVTVPRFEPPPPLEVENFTTRSKEEDNDDDEDTKLLIDTQEMEEQAEEQAPVELPQTQRELYLRIQAQQKTNLPEEQVEDSAFDVDENINWYSDDDDEDRLMIKVDNDEERKEDSDQHNIKSPPLIKPQEVVEKLGDLSKIDISAEVTKLLTSITQTSNFQEVVTKTTLAKVRDPRQPAQALDTTVVPTVSDLAQVKLPSIYEQGRIGADEPSSPDDVIENDIRGRPDVDLRNFNLPFKGMANYTPAKEIDASINSHPPIAWHVEIVDIPRPDYTGLKLNVQEAEKTGDPRLKKIFRLGVSEDSPASPKASPKSTNPTSARIDPRLKKPDVQSQPESIIGGPMTYNQQLNILQSSAFFQSLTSNQKVLLNQELAMRNEQNGIQDSFLPSLLTNLNLVPSNAPPPTMAPPNMGVNLNMLAGVNKLNPALMATPPMVNFPPLGGLLGAAPGIPNMTAPMGYDPRNGGGLLGQGPFGGGYPPDNNFGSGGGSSGGNFNDDYYPPQQDVNYGGINRDRNYGGGGGNRDRRRGRNNFNRNNRNFRNRNNNNRNNRGHTPP